MGNPTKRVQRWDKKYNVTRISAILTDLRDGMFAEVTTVTPPLVEMETQVQQVIDQEGVSQIQRAYYLSFGRQVWSLARTGESGESLAMAVSVLIGTWVAYGLSQSILETIRTQVFNVGAPTP